MKLFCAYLQKENSSEELEISDMYVYLSASVALIVAVYFMFSCSSLSAISSLPVPEYWNGPEMFSVVPFLRLTKYFSGKQV